MHHSRYPSLPEITTSGKVNKDIDPSLALADAARQEGGTMSTDEALRIVRRLQENGIILTPKPNA